ncbi:MAG: glycerophosphoryl diester phosphodiesterase membrane domain-containing protein [Micropepsaceae bacterium]
MAMAGTRENFDIGRVIQRTMALVGRNFVPFFVLALVLTGIPSLLLQVAMPTDPAALQQAPGVYFTSLIIGVLVSVATGVILQGTLTRASVDDLSGKGVQLGAAVSNAVALILPLVGLGLLVGLGVGVGFLALVIPGIFLLLCWMVASPVMVVERLGVTASMQRSMQLTQGHRWAILGLIVLFFIAYMIVAAVVGALVGGVMLSDLASADGPPLTFLIVMTLVGVVLSVVGTVGAAAIYFELRQIKEGVGVTELAQVFS